MPVATRTLALAFWLGLGLVACKGDAKKTEGSSSASPGGGAETPSGPKPFAMCDYTVIGEHNCFEIFDDKQMKDLEVTCSLSDKKPTLDARCPSGERVGACLLSDGRLRYSYPPMTVAKAEEHCKVSEGKFAAGSKAPEPDPKVTYSCLDGDGDSCREETSVTTAAVTVAEKSCVGMENKFSKGECPKKDVVARCLQPSRTTFFYKGKGTIDAAKDTCKDRSGEFVVP